jgi:hypothetical protein
MNKRLCDTTRLQPVVLQLHTYDQKGLAVSYEIEVPPAKAWWCQRVTEKPRLAVKLKYHRLTPGGVKVV